MMNIDDFLLNEADKHWQECEPTIVDSGEEFEGYDENGNVEFSTWYVYNCRGCDVKNCKYWSEYNDEDEE